MNKRIIFIDDEHGPTEMYVEALQDVGLEVRHIDSMPEALQHLAAVRDGPDTFGDLYLIDIMMPAVVEDLVERTNTGLTSGLYLLDQLMEIHNRKKEEGAIPVSSKLNVFMLTAVSNPTILSSINESYGVEVLAKLDWLPSHLAERARKILS